MGCLLYTEADWVAYYFVLEGRCIMLPMRALRPWLARRLPDFQSKLVPNSSTTKTLAYHGLGCPVPVATVLREVTGVSQLTNLPRFGAV